MLGRSESDPGDHGGDGVGAVYLYIPGKDALFAAVVDNLCESPQRAARDALWRTGLTLVPQSVARIDALIVEEVAAGLRAALGGRRWPVVEVSLEQSAQVLQATSYCVKQQTADRAEYLAGIRAAIGLVLTAGGLTSGRTGSRA